ncbi:hypothetical protein NIES2101_03410 [Calothrix sp. HK-06]|nr:hypothetical protein NIES2101_03410 [Calothrix sp. HK-06]
MLVSEIGMPEMDGYMLMRELKALSVEPLELLPAIALTAYAGEINQQQALKAGFKLMLPNLLNLVYSLRQSPV